MITGESHPVEKGPGAKVIAGTINGDGSLRVRVTATGDETTLARIMRLVELAQQSKSQTQILADKAAGWLFYIAIAAALLTAIGWTIVDRFDIDVLNRVVTVLVIACPHALGLAVPLVVAITTTMGAKNGILIRDRLALEAARDIDIVVFDKTGTLTKGQFEVVDMITDGWDEERACGGRSVGRRLRASDRPSHPSLRARPKAGSAFCERFLCLEGARRAGYFPK